MKSWQPVSLEKYLNFEVILISEFMILEIGINSEKLFEVILISDFMNPEIRITSTFRSFSLAGLVARIKF